MTVPTFQELMLPLLRQASQEAEETYIGGLEPAIAGTLKLTDEDTSRLLPSGKQTVYSNRLNWAKSYMAKAGLLQSTRRGYFVITQRGLDLLADKPGSINLGTLARFPEFVAWKSRQRSGEEGVSAAVASLDADIASPDEQMAAIYERVTRELSLDLIERVHSLPPSFFERMIVDLLLAMGYGGGRTEMGRALGKSGDGGVDGVIKEDELGLDVVYIQAKRYAPENAVPVREVRDFIGSLEGHRASKGVFVTTSYFPESAIEFVGRVSKRVTLVGGSELARLMIRHNVGVRVKDAYEIKRVDEDYFVD